VEFQVLGRDHLLLNPDEVLHLLGEGFFRFRLQLLRNRRRLWFSVAVRSGCGGQSGQYQTQNQCDPHGQSLRWQAREQSSEITVARQTLSGHQPVCYRFSAWWKPSQGALAGVSSVLVGRAEPTYAAPTLR